jgi:hypothetical protein
MKYLIFAFLLIYKPGLSQKIIIHYDSVNFPELKNIPEYQFHVIDTREGYKIITDYPCIYNRILTHYPDKIRSYYVEYKHDKGGKFHRYTFYFSPGGKQEVIYFLTNNTD